MKHFFHGKKHCFFLRFCSERKIHSAPFKKPAANLFNALKIKNKTKGKSEKDSAFRLVFC